MLSNFHDGFDEDVQFIDNNQDYNKLNQEMTENFGKHDLQ